MTFLIYGATGYTGKLIARRAKEMGLSPILAGRNAEKVQLVAEPLGFDWKAFELSDTPSLDDALANVDLVLHIAGPFSSTSKPMADACIKHGVHYTDITGEIDVFEALAARDEEAKKANIMLMPGVGFDVVPSDCLASHMKTRMPDANALEIFIQFAGKPSRGTAKTGIEAIRTPARIRRAAIIQGLDKPAFKTFKVDGQSYLGVTVSWGDVSTAFHSTTIPNITVYFEAIGDIKRLATMPKIARKLFSTSWGQRFLKRQIDKMPEGPTDAERAASDCTLFAFAKNAQGQEICSQLTTPDGYSLTAETALAIVKRIQSGFQRSGFSTPSLAFVSDFITSFPNCELKDLY